MLNCRGLVLRSMGYTDSFFSDAELGKLTVGIIGLGYVGLPTAIGFHDAGFEVWGVDISQRTVDMVKRGENKGTQIRCFLLQEWDMPFCQDTLRTAIKGHAREATW